MPEPQDWPTPYALPRDTAEAVQGTPAARRSNLGWWLDYGATYEETRGALEVSIGAKRRDGAPKNLNSGEVQRLLKAQRDRLARQRAAYRQSGATVVDFTAHPEWRLVTGLGRDSVLETGITLHRVFGTPYIPGSGLKGAARSWAFARIAELLGVAAVTATRREELEKQHQATPGQLLDRLLLAGDLKAQKQALEDLRKHPLCAGASVLKSLDNQEAWAAWTSEGLGPARFLQVFGTTAAGGGATFLDAWPSGNVTVRLDIMNPHFGKYYQGAGPPADYLDPVPVYFLAIENTPFSFTVVSRDEQVAEAAGAWLRAGLAELGVGAKASAGYGFMG